MSEAAAPTPWELPVPAWDAHMHVEVLPGHRIDSPLAYWLMVGPRSAQRPEIKAFCAWLQVQAEATRQAIGDVPDPDLNDNLDGA